MDMGRQTQQACAIDTMCVCWFLFNELEHMANLK